VEADATSISLQKKGQERGGKLEVKVGVGYSGKEARYKTGKSKRLKEKFTFIGIGKDFMEKLSLLAEERLSLSKAKKVIFGGDGDSWITSGIKDYFPSVTYILDLYHLYKKFKEFLGRRKEEQRVIKDLLLSNEIDKGLSVIDQLIRKAYDQKEKDNLVRLYTYISRNRLGISNQVKLKDQEIERAGAIESIEEAAMIDGCTPIVSLFKVTLPLSWPRLMATGLYVFIMSINQYLYPLLFTTNWKRAPITVYLSILKGQYVTDWNQTMVISLLTCFPAITLFLIFQKQFTQGIAGGLKG